jgi:5-methylcytosine-specific restriction protein A
VFWSQNTSINPHYIVPKRGVTYIDQFDNLPPGVVERLRREYPRAPEVRKKVLIRAAGHCELCGEEGFCTANGEIFLESHHVQPLSEQGQDCEWNVVALCPNDHRKAHHAHNNRAIRAELEARLKSLQQNAHLAC